MDEIENGWVLKDKADCECKRFVYCAECLRDIDYSETYYEILGEIVCCDCVANGKKQNY